MRQSPEFHVLYEIAALPLAMTFLLFRLIIRHTEPMTELDLSEFKKLLLQHQKELLDVEASGERASEVVELDQTTVGRLSRMDAMQAQAMSVEVDHRRKLELQRIKRALKHIEAGDYGTCQNCGEMINSLRLKSSLTVTLCIGCASEAETNI